MIVAAELRYGSAQKRSPKLTKKGENLLATITVLPSQTPLDSEYGCIRAELEAAGQTIDMIVLRIAAQAYTLRLMLVRDTLRDFGCIQRLKVENWLET